MNVKGGAEALIIVLKCIESCVMATEEIDCCLFLDLRQDMLTLQILRLMDMLWKEANLDLR